MCNQIFKCAIRSSSVQSDLQMCNQIFKCAIRSSYVQSDLRMIGSEIQNSVQIVCDSTWQNNYKVIFSVYIWKIFSKQLFYQSSGRDLDITASCKIYTYLWIIKLLYTVEPVLSDHSWDQKKWSLTAGGRLIKGGKKKIWIIYIEQLLNANLIFSAFFGALKINPQMPKVKIHLRTPKGGWVPPPLDFWPSRTNFLKIFLMGMFSGSRNPTVIMKKILSLLYWPWKSRSNTFLHDLSYLRL